MSEFPVPLDNLIAYVKTLHPDGGPLENVADAFAVSAMYAGLGGVLLSLAFGRIVPVTFDYAMSIEFLVMVVIGGLGSAAGAIAGAVFVSALPRILDRYSDVLPGLAQPGSEGVSPAVAARFAYGAAAIALLLVEPGGVAAVGRRLRAALARGRPNPQETP